MKASYIAPAFTLTVFEPEELLTAEMSVGTIDPNGDRDAVIIW